MTVLRTHHHDGTVGASPTAAGEGYTTLVGGTAVAYVAGGYTGQGLQWTQPGSGAFYLQDTLAGGFIGMYVKLPALPGAPLAFSNCHTAGGAICIGSLAVLPTGQFQLWTGWASAVATSTTTIPANTYYRLEWNCDAGGQTLRIFKTPSSTVPDETITGATSGGANAMFRVGMPYQGLNGGAGATVVIDEVEVANDWPAMGTGVPPVTGPIRGVIAGGVEVAVTLRGVIEAGVEVAATVQTVTIPPPTGVLQLTSLGYIGDSVTYQDGTTKVVDSLASMGWTSALSKVDGAPGRTIQGGSVTPWTMTLIDTWRASGFHPRVWVIALCTNNLDPVYHTSATWGPDVTLVLNKIAEDGPGQTVYWIGPVLRPGATLTQYVAPLEAAIEAAAAAQSGVRAIVLNMNTTWHNGRDESALWSNDLHPNGPGNDLRNTLIGNLIGGDAPPATQTPPATGDASTFTDTFQGTF